MRASSTSASLAGSQPGRCRLRPQALGLLLGDVRLGSRQLRPECDSIHLGDDLTGTDHVPLVDEDRLDPAGSLVVTSTWTDSTRPLPAANPGGSE